jgi:hypothetical protein
VKHLSCVKFVNIRINPTPQPNSERLKEISDSDEKYDKQKIFQNDSSYLHPGIIFEATVWTAHVTL